jgi:hypothetical protein
MRGDAPATYRADSTATESTTVRLVEPSNPLTVKVAVPAAKDSRHLHDTEAVRLIMSLFMHIIF